MSHKMYLSYHVSFMPNGLRRCDQNQKVPASNPTRDLAGLTDPTSL